MTVASDHRVVLWPLRLPRLAAALDRWTGERPRGLRLAVWAYGRSWGLIRYEKPEGPFSVPLSGPEAVVTIEQFRALSEVLPWGYVPRVRPFPIPLNGRPCRVTYLDLEFNETTEGEALFVHLAVAPVVATR